MDKAWEEKEAIVRRSLLLLRRDGLIFSVDDLARDLKMGKAKIYRYFPSKEALAKAVYARLHEEEMAALNEKPTVDAVLSVYQEALVYGDPALFNRYSINEAVHRFADSLLKEVEDKALSLLKEASPKASLPGFREALESALFSFAKKGGDVRELEALFLR